MIASSRNRNKILTKNYSELSRQSKCWNRLKVTSDRLWSLRTPLTGRLKFIGWISKERKFIIPVLHRNMKKMWESSLWRRTWWFQCFSFFYQINTFVTHPWIFICPRTGERLQVNNNDVFQPEPWFKFINNAANGVVAVGRQKVKIHYPLRSLRDICLWELVFLVETKDEIYDLEIPHSLKVDLLKYFRSSSRYDDDEEERSDRFIM